MPRKKGAPLRGPGTCWGQCSLDFAAVQPAPEPQWAQDLAWGRERIAARVKAREQATAARKAARLAAEAERPKGKQRMTWGEYVAAMDAMRRPVDPREWLEPAA